MLVAVCALWLCLLGGARGQQAPQALDFLTRDPIAPERVAKTKEFGLAIVGVKKNSPAARAGLQFGDLILCVDGLRFYGLGEFLLARGTKPGRTALRLTVNRRGEIRDLDLALDKPGGPPGASYRIEWSRFPSLLRLTGTSVDDELRESLKLFPPRGTALFQEWLLAKPRNKEDCLWIRGFLTLHSALTRQDYVQAQPSERTPPIPFFGRLSRFYLSLAKRHRDGLKPPDWKAHGESLDFYTLYYPFRPFEPPPMGDVTLTDQKFMSLLAAMRQDPFGSWWARSRAASHYTRPVDDRAEAYVGQVKAAILCPKRHGGWPARSTYVADEDVREKTVKALNQRLARDDNDAALYACALLGPMVRERSTERVIALLDTIHQKSPYLGMCAVHIAGGAIQSCWCGPAFYEAIERHVIEELFPDYCPKAPSLSWTLLEQVPALHFQGGFGCFVPDHNEDPVGYGERCVLRPATLRRALEVWAASGVE